MQPLALTEDPLDLLAALEPLTAAYGESPLDGRYFKIKKAN
jgi:hypothetical protein